MEPYRDTIDGGGDLGAAALFRPLRPGDAPALRELYAQVFPLTYDQWFYDQATSGDRGLWSWAALEPPPAAPPPAALPAAAPLPVLVDGAARLVAAVVARACEAHELEAADRELLGVACGSGSSGEGATSYGSSSGGARFCYLLTIGVAADRRGRGLATALMRAVEARAAAEGCRLLFLHVADFNREAILFYRRLGFAEVATLPGFYSIHTGREPEPGRHAYDALLLARPVGPPPPAARGPPGWAAAVLGGLGAGAARLGALARCGAPRLKGGAPAPGWLRALFGGGGERGE